MKIISTPVPALIRPTLSGNFWEHTYEASVNIVSPTQNSAYDFDGQANVTYGGGSADAFASISFFNDPGVYDIELWVSIFCMVAIRDTGTPGGEENFVIVQGGDGMYTIYAHVTPSVEENDTVSAGDKIGTVDNTGDTTGSHVHLCRSPIQSCSQGVDYELPDCP